MVDMHTASQILIIEESPIQGLDILENRSRLVQGGTLLVIPETFANELINHALRDDPNECCGILASKDGLVTKLFQVTNVENSPYRYSMDPKELLRILREIDDNGWELLAVYHSHTHSPAYPSATDVRLASLPDAYYILISLEDKAHPVIRCFRIVDQEIIEEESMIA